MPEVLDFSKETDATLELYGLERGSTKGFAWQCLAARRMAERGVRFIELIDVGSNDNWDAHSDMKTHEPLAQKCGPADCGFAEGFEIARNVGGYARGMDDGIRTFTGSRWQEGTRPSCVTHLQVGWRVAELKAAWFMARPMRSADASRKIPLHVHDFHATILHCLGFNHEKLTFRHAGRDFRLTDVAGNVVKAILLEEKQ